MNREPHIHSTRCVHCAAKQEAHDGANGNGCVGSAGRAGKTFGTLNLPDGKTCADCVHTARCVAIFGALPTDKRCDFYPVRFLERGE